MLVVLSPAKALDFSDPPEAPVTLPRFREEAATLAKAARRLTLRDLKGLMSLSDGLAKLNRERFLAFDPESEDGVQAVFAFNGDVYRGLQARTLASADLRYSEGAVRILSGLYGLLRPFDVIQPYRLEMGSRLKTRRGADLYRFWGGRLAEALDEDLAGHADPCVINCASHEYGAAIDRKALKSPIITCHFRQEHAGEVRTLSFAAKRARGLLARFVIENRVERRDGLKAFNLEGYRFAHDQSSEMDFVFIRPAP